MSRAGARNSSYTAAERNGAAGGNENGAIIKSRKSYRKAVAFVGAARWAAKDFRRMQRQILPHERQRG